MPLHKPLEMQKTQSMEGLQQNRSVHLSHAKKPILFHKKTGDNPNRLDIGQLLQATLTKSSKNDAFFFFRSQLFSIDFFNKIYVVMRTDGTIISAGFKNRNNQGKSNMKLRYTKSFIASNLFFLSALSYTVTSKDIITLSNYVFKTKCYQLMLLDLIGSSRRITMRLMDKDFLVSFNKDVQFIKSCEYYIKSAILIGVENDDDIFQTISSVCQSKPNIYKTLFKALDIPDPLMEVAE